MIKLKSVRKLCCSAVVLLPLLTAPVCASTAKNDYFALRRQSKATELTVETVKANPQAYHGRLIELRGSLSGSVQSSDKSFFILDCGNSSYVINSTSVPQLNPGCRLCVLAQIGDNCTLSLSDLELVAFEYENTVVQREMTAQLAEDAKKAKLADAQKRQSEIENSKLDRGKGPNFATSASELSAEQFVTIYRNTIKSFNPRLPDSDADTIARSVLGFSMRYEVDPRLVMAVILAESHFNPYARSAKGAAGLGQLMPGTAAGMGVSNAYDPVQNVEASVRLIRGHLDRLSGNAHWTELTWQHLALALASYNAGPGAVRKYGGIPPYRETQGYVKKVISIYRRLCGAK